MKFQDEERRKSEEKAKELDAIKDHRINMVSFYLFSHSQNNHSLD